ncbi:MAG: sialidase family protein, partial [Verrucomicrobiota bacterium]
MPRSDFPAALTSIGLLCAAVMFSSRLLAVEVRPERVPEAGLQPDAVVDARGRVRLIYLSGDPKAADIHCVVRDPGRGAWSRPQTVNSEAGAAVALGSVRGARLALGGSGILHVVWNGSSKVPSTASGSAPLLYSRSKPSGEGFEPQRALGGQTRHLDGGAAVAADGKGTVWVVWHAALPTPPVGGDDETHRAVFLCVSHDEGRSFEPPRRIDPPGMGVCACCGLDAGIGADGGGWVLVRGAAGKSERGMQLLT